MIFIKTKKQKTSYNKDSLSEIEDRINRYKKNSSNKKINARFFQRFPTLDDNLTILYNNDILRIHDISYNGFSVLVNPNSLKKFIIGKTYCFKKFKLFTKETTIYGKVVWISEENSEIGFSIEESSNSSSKYLIEQLVLPWEISSSLKPVESLHYISESENTNRNKDSNYTTLIYKGLLNTEVYIVLNKENNLEYFNIFSNNFYLQWKQGELCTGTFSYKDLSSNLEEKTTPTDDSNKVIYINSSSTQHQSKNVSRKDIPFILSEGEIILTKDKNINFIHKLFLYTIIKKSSIPNRDLILKALE